MPRTGRIKKRLLSPDPVYQSRLVARLVNRVMKAGKKKLAYKHVYQAFEEVKKETKENPDEVFRKALDNLKPIMEVRPRRVGGASYQVPIPVKGDRKESLAIRWLIEAAESRPSREYRTFSKKLAAEIIAAFKGEGGAIQKKHAIQKLAEANKAFAHFRW
jgi:small subunit ribosomal protein S7